MMINKSQGQSLGTVGIDLCYPVFYHCQFYVAVSRATNWGRVHIHNRSLHGGLWAFFVISSVFEIERASVRPCLFASRVPPAPSFNLFGPAFTATFGFRRFNKCLRGAEQRRASATCRPSPPPSPPLQLRTLNSESRALRFVLRKRPLCAPAFPTTLLHLC